MRQSKSKQTQICAACGYPLGINHEKWCPDLHQEEWSFLLRAWRGPGSKQPFYEGRVNDVESLPHLFRKWLSSETGFSEVPADPFLLEVFHRFRDLVMSYTTYTISFAKRELRGNSHSQTIQQAWEQADGVYRQS